MSANESVEQYERKVTAAERFFARSPFAIITMVLRINGHVLWNELDVLAGPALA